MTARCADAVEKPSWSRWPTLARSRSSIVQQAAFAREAEAEHLARVGEAVQVRGERLEAVRVRGALGKDREVRAQPVEDDVHGRDVHALEQPVRGKDGEPGVAHAAQVDHEPVGARVAGGAPLVAVVDGGLVAVVAVGDEERALAERARRRDRRARRSTGAMRCVLPSRSCAVWAAAGPPKAASAAAASAAVTAPSSSGYSMKTWLSRGVRRAHQRQAVGLRAGVRLLVRQHDALGERRQAQAGHDSAPQALVAVGAAVGLLDEVEGRRLVAHEDAVVVPAPELRRRAGVGVVVAGQLPARRCRRMPGRASASTAVAGRSTWMAL